MQMPTLEACELIDHDHHKKLLFPIYGIQQQWKQLMYLISRPPLHHRAKTYVGQCYFLLHIYFISALSTWSTVPISFYFTIGNRPRARRMPLVFNHHPKIMQIPSSSGQLSENTNQLRRLLEPMSHWQRAIVSQCRWWWMLIKKWDGNERCSSTFTASPPRLCFWN